MAQDLEKEEGVRYRVSLHIFAFLADRGTVFREQRVALSTEH